MSLTYVYPFDPTGSLTSNVIPNERHVLSEVSNSEFNFVIPKFAPFFSRGMRVRHLGLGRDLVEGVDFHLTHWFHAGSYGVGRSLYGSITFLDKAVAGVIEIYYQTIGGDWVYDENTILEIMSNRLINPRITTWEQVVDLPFQFPVIDHEWDLVDLTGGAEIVAKLHEIVEAINQSNEANGQLHVTDYANPHGVTKAQVGLDIVENYRTANIAEARTGLSNELYMTPQRVRNFSENYVPPLIEAHTIRADNPHGVTKAQIGLGNVQNYGTATNQQTVDGSSTVLYVTPLGLKTVIDTSVLPVLQSHTVNLNNPHAVTKAQVGLDLVPNYQIATTPEAIAGSRNDRFMTPLTTYSLINEYVGDGMDNHISGVDNPHRVTKTQVGLGSVENLAVATPEETVAGTSNFLYVTPMGVRKAINDVAIAAYQAHTNDGNNPHGTTKAQIGLGFVDNFPTATLEEAIAGTNGSRFMTPLTTQAVLANIVGASLEGHTLLRDNPHGVTKAQVGLGAVDNYGTANPDETVIGTSGTTFVTPLGLNKVVTETIMPVVDGHTSNKSNPHNVTKAQVGLGNVLNYGTASGPEALSGVSSTLYMTPLSTITVVNSVVSTAVSQHSDLTNNPHTVTKAQVGLGSVENFATATNVESLEGVSDSLYMTPLNTTLVAQSAANFAVATHAENIDNPHQVTAEQIGAVTPTALQDALVSYLPATGTAVDSLKLEGYSYEDIIGTLSGTTAEDSAKLSGFSLEEIRDAFTTHIAPLATRLDGLSLSGVAEFANTTVTAAPTLLVDEYMSADASDTAWTKLLSTDIDQFTFTLSIAGLLTEDEVETSIVNFFDAGNDGIDDIQLTRYFLKGRYYPHEIVAKKVDGIYSIWVKHNSDTRGAMNGLVTGGAKVSDFDFTTELALVEPDWITLDPGYIEANATRVETSEILMTKSNMELHLEARLDVFADMMRQEAIDNAVGG